MGDFTVEQLIEGITAGDTRVISAAMNLVDDERPQAWDLLRRLYPLGGRAHIIGITGTPGVGKSTLIDGLIAACRAASLTVGVILVDATSPFTGGALLGDRLRMSRHYQDPGVFIRSIGTRGHLGGTSASARDLVLVLDAMGRDVILVETIGVGQGEVEIYEQCHTCLVLLLPGAGDDVQALKSGIMEIADIFVVNKRDLPGAERARRDVEAMLSLMPPDAPWRPPVFMTRADTGDGVEELWQGIGTHRGFCENTQAGAQRKLVAARADLRRLLAKRLQVAAEERVNAHGGLEALLEDLVARRRDPYTVVEELLAVKQSEP